MASSFGSPCSTARKSRKSLGGTKVSKNPYSSRGLDKFSALLAELEEKKQKIYAKIETDDPPMVRFVFTSAGDCVPIVIKDKSKPSSPTGKETKRKTLQVVNEKIATSESKSFNESRGSLVKENRSQLQPRSDSDSIKKLSCPLNENLHRMKSPSYYLPMTVMLILVILAMFGRSVTILCTCIAWYMVPTIKDYSKARKFKTMKEKDFTRRLSNESKGSFNQRNRDYAALKEKFSCLAARGRSA